MPFKVMKYKLAIRKYLLVSDAPESQAQQRSRMQAHTYDPVMSRLPPMSERELLQTPASAPGQDDFNRFHFPSPLQMPRLPHIYSNYPPIMFDSDLPPPPSPPGHHNIQDHQRYSNQHGGQSSSLRKFQRFGDV